MWTGWLSWFTIPHSTVYTLFCVCVCNLWHRLVEKENANKRKQRQFNALLPLFSLLLLLLLLQCMLSIIISDKFVMHKCTQTHLYTSKIQPLVHNRAHPISSSFVFILKYIEQLNEKFFNLLTVNTLLFENPSAFKVQINFTKSLDRSS